MNFQLLQLEKEDLTTFKKDMQQAFQQGAIKEFNNINTKILPESDINESLIKNGAIAYKAIVNNQIVGGAIIVIDNKTQHNHLDFLYVKHEIQNKGIGKKIWQSIENLYPNTKVWETYTPYFEKRNIHFYINQCGFSAVEFFNPKHPDSLLQSSKNMVGSDYFFRFEKKMYY